MDLLEHQGKELFARWALPVPRSFVAREPDVAVEAAQELGPVVAVKAQVRIGGRGKAGGVRVARSPEEVREAAETILGLTIRGHEVREVLVEEGVDVAQESYLSILLDRAARSHTIIASAEGGVDIEAVAAATPEKITRVPVDPLLGLQDYQVKRVVRGLGVPAEEARETAGVLRRLFALYLDEEATLVEVNPIVVTEQGKVVLLDSKVTLDDAASFRHPERAELAGNGDRDEQERLAAEAGLSSFVRLDGDIGIVGNGAGLVMSTLDLVDQVGGRPANFLDVGGGADAAVLSGALRLVLADGRARSILVNIFGGITRCDLVAEGVVDALGRVEAKIPIVVRLAGTNAAEGRRILEQSPHPKLISAETMLEAAERAVEATR